MGDAYDYRRSMTVNQQQRMKNRLSVKKLGVGIPGLVPASQGVNQKIELAPSAKRLIASALNKLGCVKIMLENNMFVGTNIDVSSAKNWGEKLDSLVRYLKIDIPTIFVLFRANDNCLIVSFVPEMAQVKFKMEHASSKESLKDAILDIDENINLEEFNVSDPGELSFSKYDAKMNAPKPFTDHELARQEQDQAETGGSYGILARLKKLQNGETDNRDVQSGDANARPVALPGLSGGFNFAAVKLKKTGAKGGKGVPSSSPSPAQQVVLKPQAKLKIKKQGVALPIITPPAVPARKVPTAPEPEQNVDVAPPPVPPPRMKSEVNESIENSPEPPPSPALDADLDDLLAPTAQATPELMESVKVVIKPAPEPLIQPPVQEEEQNDEEINEEVSSDEEKDEADDAQAQLELDQAREMAPVPSVERDLPPTPPEGLEAQDNITDELPAGNANLPADPIITKVPSRAESFVQSASRIGRNIGKKGSSVSARFANGFRGMFSKRGKASKSNLSQEQLGILPDNDGEATYEELKNAIQTGELQDFDQQKMESYLSSREFAQVFKMTKENFYKLKASEQAKRKRKAGLL